MFRRKPKKNNPENKSPTAKKRRTKKHGLLRRMFNWCFYWALVLGLWAGIVSTCLLGFYAAQLPQSSTWKVPDRPPNARILAQNAKLIANRGNSGGESIRLSQISPVIPQAVIAIEDRRFYYHFGIDPIGLLRASYKNWRKGRIIEGGSTLTQQLAKNLFLKPERTFKRKMQEIILALWLEWKYSKEELLEIYLNRVYLGAGTYGVDAASKRYFQKSPQNVNLMEAATLAGLLKAPSRYSPAKAPKLAKKRAQTVLSAMVATGYISKKQRHDALTTKGQKAPRIRLGSEHYAADLVMQEYEALFGELKEDVIIETSLDLSLQKAAEQNIKTALKKYGKAKNIAQGALVSLAPNGEIKALIGGKNYDQSQYNRAANARRQPGSAFKPILYLTALERGMTPYSLRVDEPIKIGKWRPKNYNKTYLGSITLDEALSLSINTIAAKLVLEVGPSRVVKTARRLGIQSKLNPNASIALGTSEVNLLELTNAYTNFANGGFGTIPHLIKRVLNRSGEILYEYDFGKPPRTIAPEILGPLNAMMSHVVENGTGKNAQVKGFAIGGKTGTTQGFRDSLFVGYSADYITGVWYGNDDNAPMRGVTGGGLPAHTFANFMTIAHKGFVAKPLPGKFLKTYPKASKTQNLVKSNKIDQILQQQGQNLQGEPLQGEPSQKLGISKLLKHLDRGELAPAPDVRPKENVGATRLFF